MARLDWLLYDFEMKRTSQCWRSRVTMSAKQADLEASGGATSAGGYILQGA
jgi:hypothetical protein